LLPTGPRLTHHHSVNKIPSRVPERLLPDAFLCWSSTSPLADWSSSSAPWSSPLFASLYLRRRRLGLRRSSLAFIFAAGALVFGTLRLAEPVEDLVVASRLSAGLRSMAEGGVPNSSPSESLSILGGAMTSTSSPEAVWRGLSLEFPANQWDKYRGVIGAFMNIFKKI